MVGSLQMKSGPSSALSSTKIKTLIHTLIFSHVCRIIRALSKAKTILIEVLKEIQSAHIVHSQNKNKKYRNKKLFVGSFRLHYNWCSSHVVPVPAPVLDGASKAHLYCDSHKKERVGVPETHLYYDSTWNSVPSTEQGEDCGESQLSGYLQWLEQKVHDDSTSEKDLNEIDKLAERFIANCHEKFRLEKEESHRRFQEMMTRSL